MIIYKKKHDISDDDDWILHSVFPDVLSFETISLVS